MGEALGVPFPGVSAIRTLQVAPSFGEKPVASRRVEATGSVFADGQGVGVKGAFANPVYPGLSPVVAPYEGAGFDADEQATRHGGVGGDPAHVAGLGLRRGTPFRGGGEPAPRFELPPGATPPLPPKQGARLRPPADDPPPLPPPPRAY